MLFKDVCQEMAAIIVFVNQEDGEGFAQLLRYIFESEIQILRNLTAEDLDDSICSKKTPFVVYLAAYWLSMAVYNHYPENPVLKSLFNIHKILLDLANQSKLLSHVFFWLESAG